MIAEEIGVSEGTVRTARKQSGSQDYEPVWEALACRFTPAGFSCSTAFSPLYWLQSLLRGESDVASGTVKWFNGQKGYGFIAPDTGGKDVFVHISAVEKAGLDGLPDGAKVTFDIVPNRGKESAENLRVK
jgi:CspA family cold shock protein